MSKKIIRIMKVGMFYSVSPVEPLIKITLNTMQDASRVLL